MHVFCKIFLQQLRLTSICICNTRFCLNLYFSYQNVVATAEYIQHACLDTSLTSTSLMQLISLSSCGWPRIGFSSCPNIYISIHSCFKCYSTIPFQNFPPCNTRLLSAYIFWLGKFSLFLSPSKNANRKSAKHGLLTSLLVSQLIMYVILLAY